MTYYIESGTGKRVEQPTLAGTGTPSPAQQGLPDAKASPLLTFSQSLDAAVNLARKSRNQGAVGLMAPFQGTVAASDFNSILSGLNTASDKTSSNLIKSATDISSSKLLSVSDAKSLGVPYGTTEAEAAGKGIIPKNDVSDLLVRSGNLNYTRADYSDDASQLESSRGEDRWVDPTIYQKLYETWISPPHNGKIADFVKTFPPEQYVNPANTWLPPYLMPKKSGVSNPFAS